jgi:hypothetical protein
MPTNIRLYSASSFEQAWEEVLAPWFKRELQIACHNSLPCAAVVPSHALTSLLKTRLVHARLPLFAIHLWTPEDLGKYLRKCCLPGNNIALREDLRLLMATAADDFPEFPVAAAIAADPDQLLNAYDTLQHAAQPNVSLRGDIVRRIVSRFEELLLLSGLLSEPQANRKIAEEPSRDALHLSSLLLYGFGAREWRQRFLLKGAINSANRVSFCMPESRCESERLWQATWEEDYGEAELISGGEQPDNPYKSRAHNLEMDRLDEETSGKSTIHYRMAANVKLEALAVVAQGVDYLLQPTCNRLGIVVPRESALAREVAACLIRFEIPHHDTIGFYPVQPVKQALLNCWVEFQMDARLSQIINFLHLRREHQMISADDAAKIERSLKKTLDTVITDDLRVIREWLIESEPMGAGLTFLEDWPQIPAKAPFSHFLSLATKALIFLDWDERAEFLTRHADGLIQALDYPIDRRHFLQWLIEINRTPGRTRHLLGRQPLAPLQLLAYEQIQDQSFTHLIVAGLNHGAWPPEMHPNAFLPETVMVDINRAVTVQGSQGEGHQVVKKDVGLILTAEEIRSQALAQFINLLECVKVGLTVSASLSTEENYNRSVLISDFLLRLYWVDKGIFLNEIHLQALSKKTAAWCESLQSAETDSTSDIDHMLHAFNIRRDPSKGYGEYEFSFQSPPQGGLQLSCKSWEDVLSRPASVWFEKVLGVSKSPDFNHAVSQPLFVGNWVHHWMHRSTSQGFSPLPGKGDWAAQVRDSATNTFEKVSRAYERANRSLPDWWHSLWAEAFQYSRDLADAVAAIENWPFIASELDLKSTLASLNDDLKFPLSGRIDLVFSTEDISAINDETTLPDSADFWVIDFKTGRDKALSPTTLKKGAGLQIALYMLALHARGGRRIVASVLRPDSEPSPQIDLETIFDLNDLWRGLTAIQESGVIGMSGPIYSRYSFVGDYPIATLSISSDILNEKWMRSHPLLPLP